MIALWTMAVAMAGPPALVAGQTGPAKCGSGTNSVGIQGWRVEGLCSGTPTCTYTFQAPIDSCSALHDEAVPYLSGWRMETQPHDVVSQMHRFVIDFDKFTLDRTGPVPMLHATLEIGVDRAEGYPSDAFEFSLWFEVLSYDSVQTEVVRWKQGGGSAHSTKTVTGPGKMDFVGLTSVDMDAEREDGAGA